MKDDRWGEYIPWFLRNPDGAGSGNFDICFTRLGQRLARVFTYNEAGIENSDYFGARLESESLQRFQHHPGQLLGPQIQAFFDPETMRSHARSLSVSDPEEAAVQEINRESARRRSSLSSPGAHPPAEDYTTAKARADNTRDARVTRHFRHLIVERIGVLEVLLRMLYALPSMKGDLSGDVRKYFAEAAVQLDIRGTPPLVVPMEEPLLEEEVIRKLLPRLEHQYPERAKELIDVYHTVVTGQKTLDSVFVEGFKTLEELARQLTGDPAFLFEPKPMSKHFRMLHQTTLKSIFNLKDQRGAIGSHARSAPTNQEIRYLLFQICNIALLLIEVKAP